jgi:hypothetical protein
MERNRTAKSSAPRLRVTVTDADRASVREAMRPSLEAGERFRTSLVLLIADLRAWLAPGAEGDDLWRLASTPKRERAKLWDAALRMSRRLPAGLENPEARETLLAEANLLRMEWRKYFREQLLAPGLIWALSEMMKPQFIRLGKAGPRIRAGRRKRLSLAPT